MNDRQKPSTLEDVAHAAGVSTATVSRCLNDPEKVVEATRKKVMQAVTDLDYSPNFGARVMAAKRTMTIGAVIPTMENAIFARGLQAFQEELRSMGYHLLVASSSYEAKIEAEQVRELVARGADGLLLIGHDRLDETTAFIKQRGLPAVVAWAHTGPADFASVGFDNRKAMKLLTRQVIALGHRDIAVITAELAHNDRARGRVDGIKDAMAEAGLPTNFPLRETPYDISNGGEMFAALMQADIKPTAVLCGNDILAVGAILRAREMGLSVPEDVSITGFDDIEIANVVLPSLTTVHVPHSAMGSAAARKLVQMIEDGSDTKAQELETYIQTRQSLGAPKDRK